MTPHLLRAGLLAFALTGIQAAAQAPDPALHSAGVEAPVRALVAAMQAEDAAGIRAQFAPIATQAYGANGRMKSAEATARWLESDIIERKGKVDKPVFSVEGNQVTVRGQYTSRGYASQADFLFTVDSGRITSWRMRY